MMNKRKLIIAAVAAVAIVGFVIYEANINDMVPALAGSAAPKLKTGETAYTGNHWFDEVHAPNVVDTRTVINGIKVPPMPDAKLNVATVPGADSDHNGIRDDLDRALAEQFGGDMREYQSAYAVTKIIEDIVQNPSSEKTKQYGDATRCFTYQMRLKLSTIERLATNTGARNAAYGKTFVGWSGAGSIKDCPNEAEIRNSFLNSK